MVCSGGAGFLTIYPLTIWRYRGGGTQSREYTNAWSNELGLHNMSGNVLEWCWNRYGTNQGGAQTAHDCAQDIEKRIGADIHGKLSPLCFSRSGGMATLPP